MSDEEARVPGRDTPGEDGTGNRANGTGVNETGADGNGTDRTGADETRADGTRADGTGEGWDDVDGTEFDMAFIREAGTKEPSARARMLTARWSREGGAPGPQPWRADQPPAGWFWSRSRRAERKERKRRRRRGR